MSSERIFNIFVYFDAGVAREYGIRHHRISGTDDEKTEYLRLRVDADHALARRFTLPRAFTPEQWRAAQRHGDVLGFFEEGLAHFHAGRSPVFGQTPIVDGQPAIDVIIGAEPFRGDQVSALPGQGAVPDYLVDYASGSEIRFTELINDDYFKAIRALFNAKLYVSSAKLLMSCIDTLAFTEYGDVPGNFSRWIETYVDLTPNGITGEELWEFRNSILNMTNLASRKVIAGKVSPILPYVGTLATLPALATGAKPFNLFGLITSVADGIGRWGDSYNQDRDKFLTFIERYDLTVSDSRMASYPYPRESPPDAAPRP
ncbi:hypothetical protein [Sphingopyxis sp. JAI128]|uniref:hypothetical protein n=1 Tax=Sphingopyxis sp. JAI128 TaxID=2723066 RepID=UPI0016219D53|nr:hypothetical protein [Sphingopyxis sp. JAI128]MBB6428055.1 hypothetical protein [Sphingopyxis sp. JAI128]